MNLQVMIDPAALMFRNATQDDLDFVAWCNYAATSPSPGFSWWDPTLEGSGTDTMTFIQKAVALDVLSWCRISDFVIAADGSMPVAGAARFVMREDDYRPLDVARTSLLYEALEWDTAQVARFEGIYSAVWSNPKDETLRPSGTWTIECVAVAEQVRGRGVGRALMKHILDEAHAAGVDSVGISVTPGNDAAEHLYLSVGFQPYIEYFGEYYYGEFPGTRKFRIRLK